MIRGFQESLNALNSFGGKIKTTTNNVLQERAQAIEADAIGRCVLPSVASEISVQYIDGQWVVSTQSPVSAYLEFGTGNFAAATVSQMPQDWRDMAWQFYINGAGRTPSFPYLYPAFQDQTALLIQDLKNRL